MWEYMKRVSASSPLLLQGERCTLTHTQSETFHNKDWHKADASVHGTSGPLHTEPHDLAPISERVKESMIDHGLPYHADMFSTGETPHGCGDVPRTVHQGIRTTAADFITNSHRRDNITIKTEVTVDKILMSKQAGELSATGVAVISKTGKRVEYQAKKEVIVSAGAYCSPAVLMRSGLGPEEELKKHGIECMVDLPGVGKNLQDHVVCIFINLVVSYPSDILTLKACLRLLRGLGTKPHQRLPRLPQQRHRIHVPVVQREENRHTIHIPLWHIRLRASRRPPKRLAPLAKRAPLARPRPHGPHTPATQHGVLEHRALWRAQAVRRLPHRRQAHVCHVQPALQPAVARQRNAAVCRCAGEPCRRPQLPRRPARHAGHDRGVPLCKRDRDAGEGDAGRGQGELAC
jgi:hypothetical protein